MVWVTNVDATTSPVLVHANIPPMQYLAYIGTNLGDYDFGSKLSIESRPPFFRQTAIGATIGGQTREIPIILQCMENGMNICRINVSHRTQEYHAETIHNIREAQKMYRDKTGQPFSVAIAIDTKGPEVRTGIKEPGLADIELKTGNFVKLTSDSAYINKCTNQVIYITDPNFHLSCPVGAVINIDDGKAMLECVNISGACITCKILTDCILNDRRTVTITNGFDNESVTDTKLTQVDKDDLKFAIKQRVDLILASFTHSAQNIQHIRDYMAKKHCTKIKIVAKIEDQLGLDHLNEILEVADGILIGKGDLGTQTCLEKYFMNQKQIASQCNKYGKPVISTRELWESIISERQRPTRAEMIDVGNTVSDGIDVFLFARENIKGQFPPHGLKILSAACREAEATIWSSMLHQELRNNAPTPTCLIETLAIAVVTASLKGDATAIIVLTECGKSAHIISKYRPRCPILAVTRSERTGRQSHLYRGIIPLVYKEPELEEYGADIEQKVQFAVDNGRKFGFVDKNDLIIVAFEAGTQTGLVNSFRTMYVKEKLTLVGKLLYAY